ncbi:hypothetical protein [Anaerovirgula multivorans]|uniref:hypothetical protein n=1 Tax=Anaerovirgula multivorans TaxID=312168 RepID=UPI001A9A5072|nr:hypothetical protein [Anaerovirgula multivorans]
MVFNCTNESYAITLLSSLDNLGYTWLSGENLDHHLWCGGSSCYRVDIISKAVTWGGRSLYERHNCKIVEFKGQPISIIDILKDNAQNVADNMGPARLTDTDIFWLELAYVAVKDNNLDIFSYDKTEYLLCVTMEVPAVACSSHTPYSKYYEVSISLDTLAIVLSVPTADIVRSVLSLRPPLNFKKLVVGVGVSGE